MNWILDNIVDKPWWGLLIGFLCGWNTMFALMPPYDWSNFFNAAVAALMVHSFMSNWLPTYVARRIDEQDKVDRGGYW
jgi:hypothetical protein